MNNEVLILSPHCDDVPLSIGASLSKRLLGKSVKVLIVFSQSRYTLLHPLTAPMISTTALRKKEERHVARLAGYRVDFLPFAEPFARSGYTNPEDIFDLGRDPSKEEDWDLLNESLRRIIHNHRGLVLAPLGCGGHIDHRIVTKCLRDFLEQSPGVIPIFYEDLPYASSLSTQEIRELVPFDWQGAQFLPVPMLGLSLDSKLELLKVYESQLGNDALSRVKEHWERRDGSEMFWVPQTFAGRFIQINRLTLAKTRNLKTVKKKIK